MHAMALSMVKWTFNAANADNDTWWKDMSLDAQLLCERYLQSCHRGNSKIYVTHRRIMYAIDLMAMTQQNLSTGKMRQIRRSETTFTPSSKPRLSSRMAVGRSTRLMWARPLSGLSRACFM